MSNYSPITPPPELVKKIFGDALRGSSGQHDYELRMIHAAYAAGADQELEACVEWLEWQKLVSHQNLTAYLRATRRPKSPSLKEQALLQLDTLNADLAMHGRGCDLSQIRRALEALPND